MSEINFENEKDCLIPYLRDNIMVNTHVFTCKCVQTMEIFQLQSMGRIGHSQVLVEYFYLHRFQD